MSSKSTRWCCTCARSARAEFRVLQVQAQGGFGRLLHLWGAVVDSLHGPRLNRASGRFPVGGGDGAPLAGSLTSLTRTGSLVSRDLAGREGALRTGQANGAWDGASMHEACPGGLRGADQLQHCMHRKRRWSYACLALPPSHGRSSTGAALPARSVALQQFASYLPGSGALQQLAGCRACFLAHFHTA
ncbi:hypothetical protein C8F00_3962 [Xanthomonas vasicola]